MQLPALGIEKNYDSDSSAGGFGVTGKKVTEVRPWGPYPRARYFLLSEEQVESADDDGYIQVEDARPGVPNKAAKFRPASEKPFASFRIHLDDIQYHCVAPLVWIIVSLCSGTATYTDSEAGMMKAMHAPAGRFSVIADLGLIIEHVEVKAGYDGSLLVADDGAKFYKNAIRNIIGGYVASQGASPRVEFHAVGNPGGPSAWDIYFCDPAKPSKLGTSQTVHIVAGYAR